MKRALLLIALLCLAPTIIDQVDADFNGTITNTNVTNNSVQLAGEPGNYSLSGNYVSDIKDLGSNPSGTLSWNATSPSGTSVLVTTRAGNTTPYDGTWSSWSSTITSGSTIIPPSWRYYQYRLQLATTNQSQTSAVNLVRIDYTEAGTTIAAATSQNSDLDSDTTGAYRFHVTTTDTVNITLRQARYRIDNGSWSAYTNLTQTGSYWYIDVPEPVGTWNGSKGDLLYIQVQTNNTRSIGSNNTFSDLIDAINHAPTITALSDITGTEGQQITRSLSAYDQDLDALTFTSTAGSVTSTGNTTGTLTWTPSNVQTGLLNVTVTVSDTSLTASTTFEANITEVNSLPVLGDIQDQTGYYGDRITWELTATDNDTQENLTYTVTPALFEVESYDDPNSSGYNARADFYAFDDFKGFTNFTFTVSDAQGSDSGWATLNISYCGDDICQAEENATSCSADCAARINPRPDRIALDIPERLCRNQSIIMQAYNASDRSECFNEGRTFAFNAYCEPEEDVEITVYRKNGSRLTEISTLSTNSTGQATLLTMVSSQYKLVAVQEGFSGTEQVITVKSCDAGISDQQRVVEYDRPQVEAEQRRVEVPPELERPAITPEETSLVAIIIWYVIIPIFSAALLYTSTLYYSVYKDADARLLRMRIWLWERRQRLAPYLRPIRDRVGAVIGPAWQRIKPILADLGLEKVWNWSKKKLEPPR